MFAAIGSTITQAISGSKRANAARMDMRSL